ncbi:MAG: ABC transporter ATP-binding protein [Methanomassiliicoccaceae archaeon]|nr:ABC transporter ATP-binding protein [Methanomassiliicoccaceae archaeon]
MLAQLFNADICRKCGDIFTNAIDVSGLTKSFGGFTAVNNVNMTVRKGEYMGLLGPNGAGKSTMLKVITGMLSPTSGSAFVNGVDCKDHRKAMETVGCVIETPECYPNFTPTEILSYVGKLRGITGPGLNARIREVLDEVRMWEWRDRPIGKFSKGMKQRITLAQALMPDPDILIFDEPTSGLDPRGLVEVREILKGLKRSDRSLLVSTHMLNEVSEVCDSVTIIRRGQVVLSDNVKDLLKRKAGNVTIDVTVRNSITQGFMDDLKNFVGISDAQRTDEHSFAATFSGNDDREGIVELVKQHRLGLFSLNQKGSDLETSYLSLTGEEDKDDIR